VIEPKVYWAVPGERPSRQKEVISVIRIDGTCGGVFPYSELSTKANHCKSSVPASSISGSFLALDRSLAEAGEAFPAFAASALMVRALAALLPSLFRVRQPIPNKMHVIGDELRMPGGAVA
jgi:hypothetical protein